MKRLTTLLLFFAFSSLLLIPQSKSYARKPAQTGGAYKANQILVKFKPQAILPGNKAQMTREILPNIALDTEALDGEGKNGAFVVQLDGSISVEEAVARAQSDPRVEYAEPNRIIEPHE